jgi:hypothetical protein
MLKIRDVEITPATYDILNTKVRELSTNRGRFFTDFPEEWELILRVISTGINNSLSLFSYEALQDILDGKKEIKAILLRRAMEMFDKSYSLLTRLSYKSGPTGHGVPIQKATEAFNEFYDNHLYGYLEHIARRPKKFAASGKAEDSLTCAKNEKLYDCCRDYRERAWVALAILKKDPLLKAARLKDQVKFTLVEFDGRASKKTDNAVLTSKMEKIARVFKGDNNKVFQLYGRFFLTGAVARYFTETTEPPRRRNRNRPDFFQHKVDIRRNYTGKDLAEKGEESFAWEEEQVHGVMNYIKAVRRRTVMVKAALPAGGVEEMYAKVFEHINLNLMEFITIPSDKDRPDSPEKDLASIFLEGFPVDKALKILNKTLNQK